MANYGVPLYGAAWVPSTVTAEEDSGGDSETPSASEKRLVVLAGGGGAGNNGIPNALLLSEFDFESNSLSDQPVANLGTGNELPYRIGVHPGGNGIICAFPNCCRWFEWDSTSIDEHALSLRPSERVLEPLEDVRQQLALTFNNLGTLLAVGGEDGKLRVFKWPSMEIILSEENAHSSVKNLDFSPDGKFLVSVGGGPGRIWDVASSSAVAALPRENDKDFGHCQFSHSTDADIVLYTTSVRGVSIVKWNTTSWRRISSTFVSKDPISAFKASPDGKLLAVGTSEGGILIISSANMRVQTVVERAHLGAVTALAFSPDSRAVLSASLDSSSKVSLIKDTAQITSTGMSLWIVLLIILLAVALYCAKDHGFLNR